MPVLHYLNCVKTGTQVFKNVIGRCILTENDNRLILTETGFRWKGLKFPGERIGLPIIEAGGFSLKEVLTALRQLEKRGYMHEDVTYCIASLRGTDYAGNAYYLPAELTDTLRPVRKLAAIRTDDNEKHAESGEKLKQAHPDVIMFGYSSYNKFLPFITNKTH